MTRLTTSSTGVVICFQISIFEPLKTVKHKNRSQKDELWFAFKLVSLNHWKQSHTRIRRRCSVVICFQISIFEPLKTVIPGKWHGKFPLWFAFKLVSLNHWKQSSAVAFTLGSVVICFQISIFEPLKTVLPAAICAPLRCDLLSN